jgi:peptidoglycan-associated lipoprotein
MVSRWTAILPLMLFGAACASKPPPVREPNIVETASVRPQPANGNARGTVGVSDDIARACNIQFGSVDRAPKFDFAETDLLPEDRSLLQQVAPCITTGPLKGRGLRLVGRADPRGEVEYNMTLGAHRADTVRRYLADLGVDAKKVGETSRGKLDATGTDENGWRRDRRVDIMLQ